MTAAPERAAVIRASLMRKSFADAAQRAAVARHLGLTESEVLALQHIAMAGDLTPGQISERLRLSSGGTTGLIHRMEVAGYVLRTGNPGDRRTARLSLTAKVRDLTDLWVPLVADIDSFVERMSDAEAEAVQRFLNATVEAAERHAQRVAAEAQASARDALAVPVPALWA
jgi:DNA-binding MarR family transcriptional regulator